jgi:hypothetical protein
MRKAKLKHEDFDSDGGTPVESICAIPDVIRTINFSHDGGRIEILINGKDIYKTMSGTRDCSITITLDEKEN